MSERLKTNWVGWATPGSYTWHVPVNVKWIKGLIIGGGGGGGGGSASYGGGSGGTGAIIAFQSPVTPGESLSITVGAGGAGGNGGSSPTNGNNGGTSAINFNDNSSLQAAGGGGGGAGSSTAGGSAGGGALSFENILRPMLFSSLSGNTGNAGSSSTGGDWTKPPIVNNWFNGFSDVQYGIGMGGAGGSLNENGYAGINGVVFIWWEE